MIWMSTYSHSLTYTHSLSLFHFLFLSLFLHSSYSCRLLTQWPYENIYSSPLRRQYVMASSLWDFFMTFCMMVHVWTVLPGPPPFLSLSLSLSYFSLASYSSLRTSKWSRLIVLFDNRVCSQWCGEYPCVPPLRDSRSNRLVCYVSPRIKCESVLCADGLPSPPHPPPLPLGRWISLLCLRSLSPPLRRLSHCHHYHLPPSFGFGNPLSFQFLSFTFFIFIFFFFFFFFSFTHTPSLSSLSHKFRAVESSKSCASDPQALPTDENDSHTNIPTSQQLSSSGEGGRRKEEGIKFIGGRSRIFPHFMQQYIPNDQKLLPNEWSELFNNKLFGR
jgi:hypothetical protein